MFTIYIYKVGNRRFDRYFHKWKNAELLLQKELSDLLKSGWKITYHIDRMNVAKGFYEYEYELLTPKGEKAELALVNGYFGDEE